MELQSSLFALDPPPVKQALTPRIAALKQEGIFIGTSSWRYEGWLGQIYTPERYVTRGKFSKKKFHEECIHEYAELFPVVGADFSFYGIQDALFWKNLFSKAPPDLKWSLKLPQDFTSKRFSLRAGAQSGQPNPSFLDADLFERSFLEPLSPYLDRVSVLMAEFTSFSNADYPEPRIFYEELDAFLAHLPPSPRFAVELRNAEFLDADYFAMLKRNHAAHVFNSWTRMPSLSEQISIEEAYTAPFTAARALLRPGRSYEQAVKQFSPYRSVQDEYPEGRRAISELIDTARTRKMSAYIHVNNRFEGNAIESISASIGNIA